MYGRELVGMPFGLIKAGQTLQSFRRDFTRGSENMYAWMMYVASHPK